MNRTPLPLATLASLAALGLVACSPGGSYQGKLVDGMTGEPRTDITVLAKAKSSDMTCQVREAKSGPDGTFTITDLCAADTYTLSVGEDTLFVPDLGEVAGSNEGAQVVELKTWRAPTAPGLYRLEGDELKRIRTFSDVESIQTADGSTTVRYPASKPVKLASSQKITPGSTLVLSDKGTIDRMEIFPLVADPAKRGFADGISIEDHVYIGVKFASDAEWEALSASFDPAKVTDVGNADRMLRYVAHDAVPAGRYAVLGKEDKVTYILDFGAPQEEVQPEAEVAADG